MAPKAKESGLPPDIISRPPLRVVRNVAFESADSFLDALSGRGERFPGNQRPGDSDGWLFRGQSDARWPLRAKALRDGEHAPTLFDGKRWSKTSHELARDQVRAELATLQRFFVVADREGLPLPEDSQALRRILFDPVTLADPLWPPAELWSFMGLAQHHGIPTRLTDWTHNPYVAAYHAAVDALREMMVGETETAPRICVWALSGKAMRKFKELERVRGYRSDLVVVTSPAAGNPNLRAQAGCFVVHVVADQYEPKRPVERPTVDEVVEASVVPGINVITEGETERDVTEPIMEQLTLPFHEVPQLLGLLAAEGIFAARLFPGYDGVRQTLEDEAHMDELQRWLEEPAPTATEP